MNIFTNTLTKNHVNYDERTPLMGLVRRHDLCFHLEKDKWTLVDNIKDATIIPTLITSENLASFEQQKKYIGELKSNQWILLLSYTHAEQHVNAEVIIKILQDTWLTVTKNVLVVHINPLFNSNRDIYYDFMFDYVKAYYTDYDSFDLRHRIWNPYGTKKSYKFTDIKNFVPKKKFLMLNNVRSPSREFKDVVRTVIRDQIISESDCFYSDPQTGRYLQPEESDNQKLMEGFKYPGGGGVTPIDRNYYYDSIISVFAETVCTSKYEVKGITEKTYIPLIQGHFVLPFGYERMIHDLKNVYGFKFPDWIDYSYDDIEDDNERLSKYIESISKVRQLSLQELADLANRDIDIRVHNRNIFFNRPYDSLYNKICDRMNSIK